MRLKEVLLLVFILSISTSLKSQKISKPKLVLGIVLENCNSEEIFRYKDQFSEGGFRRIINEGKVYRNADYNYKYSQTGVDHASVFSGTHPGRHGIISHYWYDRVKGHVEENVFDASYNSLGKDSIRGKVSPNKMLSITVGDELKLTNACSRVFGVAANAESSVFSAGHTADAAFWIDEMSGKWISSDYYTSSLYNWVENFNAKLPVDYYIDRGWYSLKDEEAGVNNSSLKRRLGLIKGFFHNLKKIKKESGRYKILKATPYINSMLTDFTKELIINENIGRDADTDILSLSYSFLDYMESGYAYDSEERIDMLYRLDMELSNLIDFLDKQIGMENVLLFVTVSQAGKMSPEYLKKRKLPGGTFNFYRAISLLKPYLNLIYGAGDWVLSYDSQQIYLNRNLIEKKGLSLKDIQDKVSEFIIQFTGVNQAIPAYALRNSFYAESAEGSGAIKNSFNQKRSGDVLVSLQPGWVNEITDREDLFAAYSDKTSVPLIFYGAGTVSGYCEKKVSIADIVPTLSKILNLPLGQDCNGNILDISGEQN